MTPREGEPPDWLIAGRYIVELPACGWRGGGAQALQAGDPGTPRRQRQAPGENVSAQVLAGKRVLLVEDEYIVAMMAEDMLAALGATVVGPAGSLATGLALARREHLDAAVLDINIQDTTVDPIADVLAGRMIPFIFATAYGSPALRERSQQAPLLD